MTLYLYNRVGRFIVETEWSQGAYCTSLLVVVEEHEAEWPDTPAWIDVDDVWERESADEETAMRTHRETLERVDADRFDDDNDEDEAAA